MLLVIVLVLNALVTRLTAAATASPRRRRGAAGRLLPWMPTGLADGSADATADPADRVDRAPHGRAAPAIPAAGDGSRRGGRPQPRASAPAGRRASVRERMRIESVWLAYGENWVVRDVSLPVRQGEVLALIGASGSGKTTLLRSLNRLTEITAGAARSGRITLDGE